MTAVEQVGLDRIMHLHTEAPDGNRNVLVLELMGKHSNLILLSDSEKILGAIKNVGTTVSRYRQILPGRDYVSPPGGEKSNFTTVSREEYDALWKLGMAEGATHDHVKSWLVAAFSGIGPFLAEEIILRAGSLEPDAVWATLQEIRRIILESDYSPRLITNDRGSAIAAYPIPSLQYPEKNQHERVSMDETVDTVYRDIVKRDEFDSEYAGLETLVRRSMAYREQMLRDLSKAIAEGEKSERYKQLGEMILASAGTIVKGEKSAKVIDYYDPEMREVEIVLDEKQTPKENAERYFKRFRKARDSAQTAVDRIDETKNELTTLKSASDRLQSAKTVQELKDLKQSLTENGLLRVEVRHAAPGKREEPEFGGAKIRRVTTSDGFEILYGENSTSNDYLTTKVARPNDWWFHARSVTGAHVVVRTANKPESVPQATIRQAAEIAALNSQAKHSSLVAVDYTLRKFVRKPRAAAPGSVTYQREKTIDVNPKL